MNPRRRALVTAGVCLAAIATATIAAPNGLGWPTCLVHAATGIPCPSCGLTRSWVAALDGRWHASLEHHLAGLPLLAATVVIGLLAVGDVVSNGDRLGRIWLRGRRAITAVTVAVLAVAWLANLTG